MDFIRVLKALADENRMKILTILINGDLCVGALSNQVNISKPAVSQHLRVLRKAGLIRGEKRGYWTHYVVNSEAIADISTKLKNLSAAPHVIKSICLRNDKIPVNKTKSEENIMCQNCCQQPDKLKDKPENCSPTMIIDCHGDTKEHQCTKENCTPENNENNE